MGMKSAASGLANGIIFGRGRPSSIKYATMAVRRQPSSSTPLSRSATKIVLILSLS
jgi:hypothetical protein